MATECYRCTIEGHSVGYHWQNVLHFLVDNNDDKTPVEMATELNDLMATRLGTHWDVFNAQGTVIQWISSKRILPSGGNSVWKEFPEGSMKGTQAVEVASVSLAPIVKLYTALDSGLQGRIFLPPPPDDEVEENAISTAYHNAALAWVEQMEGMIGDHTWGLAVYSRKTNTAYDVSTSTMSPILGQIEGRRRPL